ncbi:unnamed protein product, partial [Rotaria magnacalcarata]
MHHNQNAATMSGTSSSTVETNMASVKKNPESTSNTSSSSKEMTEGELIKEIQMGSHAR